MNHDFRQHVVPCIASAIGSVNIRGWHPLARTEGKEKLFRRDKLDLRIVLTRKEARGKTPGPKCLASSCRLGIKCIGPRKVPCRSFHNHPGTAGHNTMLFVSKGARAAARPLRHFIRRPSRRYAGHEAGHGHGDAHHPGESAFHVAGGSGNEGFGVRRASDEAQNIIC